MMDDREPDPEQGEIDPFFRPNLGVDAGPQAIMILGDVLPMRDPRVLPVSAAFLGVLESSGYRKGEILPMYREGVQHFESERPMSTRAKRRARGKRK